MSPTYCLDLVRQSRLAALAGVAVMAGLALPGCRRAQVDNPTEPLEPVLTVRQSPPGETPPAAPGAAAAGAWYRELFGEPLGQPGETPAADPRVKAVIVEVETPRTLGQAFLAEIRRAVEAQRPGDAGWSLLRLELSAPAGRSSSASQLSADLGLTALYERRPVIAFEQQTLEQCVGYMARLAGLRYAQLGRAQNPLVTWRRENVTLYEALRALLDERGFKVRFTDAGLGLTLPLKDRKTRDAFVAAAVAEILNQGRKLDRGLPALLVKPP